MDDADAVRLGDAPRTPAGRNRPPARRAAAASLKPLAEIEAVEELHDHVRRAVLQRADVEDARDVLVRDPGSRPRLLREPGDDVLVFEHLGTEELDGDPVSSPRWCAATTTPIPPAPRTRSTRYLPASTVPSRSSVNFSATSCSPATPTLVRYRSKATRFAHVNARPATRDRSLYGARRRLARALDRPVHRFGRRRHASSTTPRSPNAATASRSASRTLIASISGGSPTALLPWTTPGSRRLLQQRDLESRRALAERRQLVRRRAVRRERSVRVQTSSSVVSQPTPWTNPPSTCPRSTSGDSESPTSCRMSTRSSRYWPVKPSTSTSAHRRAVGEVVKRLAGARSLVVSGCRASR